MHLAVYLPLLIPVLAAIAARPVADQLPPAAATWLLTLSAVILAATSSAVLGLLVVSAFVRLSFVQTIGHLSGSAVSGGDTVALPVAIIAGGALAAAAAAAARMLRRRVSALRAAHRHARGLPGVTEVVVTEDSAADAYTVPGWPCRIVVTQGMLSALPGRERDVLLAHERSHARNSHYLFTSLAGLAAAANPLLRPLAAEVRYTVERWADEQAATATGDRPLAARAVAHAALATAAAPPGRDGTLSALGLIAEEAEAPPASRRADPGQAPRTRTGGGPLRSLRRTAGPVPRRVAALLAPPPVLPPLIAAAAVALVALSGASALEAARDFHQLIEIARTAR
jgi:hypothetical protein